MGSYLCCCIKYLHNTYLYVYMCLFLYVDKIKYFINIYYFILFIHEFDFTTFES